MKILIISPTPTHPQNAGNRVHIYSLANQLISRQWEVHFLYFAYENDDKKAMQLFWGDHLHLVDKKILHKKIYALTRRIWIKKAKIFRWIQLRLGKIDPAQYQYNGEVDLVRFPYAAIPKIKNLQKKFAFDIVICEYVFTTKAFTVFDRKVFKVIDTHDKFTDRFRPYLEKKLKPYWFSLYKDQEKKALDRADLILAVQDSEKDYFSSISKTKTMTYYNIPELSDLPEKTFEKKLLYFASDNVNNHTTLNFFIKEIFPLLLEKYSDVQLLVGGSICNTYKNTCPNVLITGVFAEAKDFYAQGDIFINPEISGTGYKIKTLEALSLGLPVVSTTNGALGVLHPFSNHLLIADSPSAFSNAIIDLIEQKNLRQKIKQQAKEWIKFNRTNMINTLYKELKNHAIQ